MWFAQVDVPVFEPGDVVRMISDMAEVYRLQQGHGEWNDDMALVSGYRNCFLDVIICSANNFHFNGE